MDTNFIDAVCNDFQGMLIAANEVSIKRAEFGFVNTDCDFVKSMIGTICLHAIENIFVFDKKQFINIRELINIISNE